MATSQTGDSSIAATAEAPHRPLGPGSDVWIVADIRSSKWARRIDWYLNFQIMRAERHRRPEPSAQLKTIMADAEIGAFKPSENERLLVSSAGLLPASKIVSIPFSGDAKAWAVECHAVWRDLGEPGLRVFLPDQLKVEAFRSAWPSREKLTPQSVVDLAALPPV